MPSSRRLLRIRKLAAVRDSPLQRWVGDGVREEVPVMYGQDLSAIMRELAVCPNCGLLGLVAALGGVWGGVNWHGKAGPAVARADAKLKTLKGEDSRSRTRRSRSRRDLRTRESGVKRRWRWAVVVGGSSR